MIWLLAFPPASILCLAILWVMFVLVMTMEQLRDAGRLAPVVISIGEGIAAVGVVWDVLPCNLIVATVMFFEPPRVTLQRDPDVPWYRWQISIEATVSARLRRLVMGDPTRWRTRLAIWFAATLMNSFCPVDAPHIRLP